MEDINFASSDEERFNYFNKEIFPEKFEMELVKKLSFGVIMGSSVIFISRQYEKYTERPSSHFANKEIELSWQQLNKTLFSVHNFFLKKRDDLSPSKVDLDRYVLDRSRTRRFSRDPQIRKSYEADLRKLRKISKDIQSAYEKFLYLGREIFSGHLENKPLTSRENEKIEVKPEKNSDHYPEIKKITYVEPTLAGEDLIFINDDSKKTTPINPKTPLYATIIAVANKETIDSYFVEPLKVTLEYLEDVARQKKTKLYTKGNKYKPTKLFALRNGEIKLSKGITINKISTRYYNKLLNSTSKNGGKTA